MELLCFRIFNNYAVLIQEVKGHFCGLAEGKDCDILTLRGEFLIRLSLGVGRKTRNKYNRWNTTKLTVLETFENWASLSKPRHLAYSQDRVYITDKGLHKILMVDTVSGRQSSAGYMGSGQGKWRRPMGIVADKAGNLIVLDQGNNCLNILDCSGKFVRQCCDLEPKMRRGGALRMVGDSLWLVVGGGEGGLAAFTLRPLAV